jgi:hypothetical protein
MAMGGNRYGNVVLPRALRSATVNELFSHQETYQTHINRFVAEEVDVNKTSVEELNERLNHLLTLHLGYSEIF